MPAPEHELLLDVQARDTTIDQLRHQRATLPERQELAGVQARLGGVATALADASKRRDEVAARQADLEAEAAAAAARAKDLDARLYSGAVTAARDLQSVQEEIAHLKERQSGFEDQAFEVMEALEPLESEVAGLEEQRATLAAEEQRLVAAVAAAEADLDERIAAAQAERDEVAAGLPAALATEYERLRGKLDGVGAARLVGGACQGCHLTLPAVEVDRIKKLPPDELVHCDQCGRILVP